MLGNSRSEANSSPSYNVRSQRDMFHLFHHLHAGIFDMVSPIPSPPLVPPSRKGRRPTQRPQRHGSLQSPPPRTTTRSSPTRKTTMTPRRHQMTALETETQPADPHRHIDPRTRGRTWPLRPRGRLDLQQRVRESQQTIPRTKPGTFRKRTATTSEGNRRGPGRLSGGGSRRSRSSGWLNPPCRRNRRRPSSGRRGWVRNEHRNRRRQDCRGPHRRPWRRHLKLG